MQYLRVRWLHDDPKAPIELYSAIDADGFEVQKVELFRDGSASYADRSTSTGTTMLGYVPIPGIPAINEDPQFAAVAITKAEFDRIWTNATAPAP